MSKKNIQAFSQGKKSWASTLKPSSQNKTLKGALPKGKKEWTDKQKALYKATNGFEPKKMAEYMLLKEMKKH